MPSLGADMAAGTLVEWCKKEGDEIHRGDIIAVVETQKGAIEVEAFEDGPLAKILVTPGSKVPVGTALAVIGEGEVPQAPEAEPRQKPPPPEPAPARVIPPSSTSASPAARKRAEELGVDLATIAGSGPNGSIVLADVEAGKSLPSPTSSMRDAIAAAMTRSKRDIPHYYLSHSFDVSPAITFVEEHNRAHPPEQRILPGALLVKAVAVAVREFPELNGFYEAGQRRESDAIHVGVAIAMRGGGLAAPAIHDTDTLSVADLMVRMQDLVGRVRQGSFRSSEVSDPTLTVTSLGERGVEALLPIIYPPQVAIFGFGTPQLRPWIYSGMIEQRHILTASLAADHRVSDGHRGALCLRRIAELLERPAAL